MSAKKALLIWGPLVAGVGVITFLQIRQKKKIKNAEKVPPGQEVSAAVTTVPPAPASSLFPLRNGSNNAKVKELQSLLGVTADGAFGPKTETALVAFAGVKSVDDQAHLDRLKSQAAGITNIGRATDLLAKFKKGDQAIYVSTSSPYRQVQIDAYGALIPTGKQVTLPGGKIYNNTDYILTQTTKGGNLLMQITRGALAGTYEVNPSTITLTPVSGEDKSILGMLSGLFS